MVDAVAPNPEQLDAYKRLFTEASDMTRTTRRRAKRYRRYYDYGGLDEDRRKKLRAENKPDHSINRTRAGVEGMVGVVDRGKSDPRAYPRNPQDEGASEVATDCLRYVCDTNRWHQNKVARFRNMLVEGVAAVLTEVDDQLEVRFRPIRYEEYFYDPYSRELDFSDKSYDGMAKWQYLDQVIASYPEHEAALRLAQYRGDPGDNDFGDRPDEAGSMWMDTRRKRMLVVEMYRRERGVWMKCVFCGPLMLEHGESPYLDDRGRPCNPIEAVAAYIDDDNIRYGAVEDMTGPQDEINVYRRNAAHLATFRQFQESSPDSGAADPEEVRREGARTDGVIPAGWQIVPSTDRYQMTAAQIAEAKSEIERTQVNPAIVARGDSSSGRQDLIRQQAGLTELAHLFGGLEDFELRVMRQAWSRIRQYWTQPKFVRVTDEDVTQFIQINKPIWGPPAPVIDPLTGLPKYDPTTRQIVMQPQFLGLDNSVAEMDVDIIIDTTPDTANLQAEQFKTLAELFPAFREAGVRPPFKGLIRNSSLPKKRELIDEIEQGSEQGSQQGPTPEQQAALELQMRKAQSEINKTDAQAEQARADAVKTMGEARGNALTQQAQEMETRWMTAGQPGF